VSVVTVEEMLRGRLAILAQRSEGEARVHAYTKLLETVRFFSTIPVVPFDIASSLRCSTAHSASRSRGSRPPPIFTGILGHHRDHERQEP
jgi:predicted nucleic acid-binding protein